MIRRLSYVACDACGNPAQPDDGALNARRVAHSEGFVRRDGKDLCPDCAGRRGYRDDFGRWHDLPPETSR